MLRLQLRLLTEVECCARTLTETIGFDSQRFLENRLYFCQFSFMFFVDTVCDLPGPEKTKCTVRIHIAGCLAIAVYTGPLGRCLACPACASPHSVSAKARWGKRGSPRDANFALPTHSLRREVVGEGALRGRSPRTREGRIGPTARNCSNQ